MWAFVPSMGHGPEEARDRPWSVYSHVSRTYVEQGTVSVINLARRTVLRAPGQAKPYALRGEARIGLPIAPDASFNEISSQAPRSM